MRRLWPRTGAGVSNAADKPRNGSGSRPTLLVVEDDADTQCFMRTLLGRSFDVLLAANGDEMRARLREHGAPRRSDR